MLPDTKSVVQLKPQAGPVQARSYMMVELCVCVNTGDETVGSIMGANLWS
jgi:hypothetical protein